jgi:hypothetical protein
MPAAAKIRTEASSVPSLKRKTRWSPTRRRWPRAKALQRPERTALPPAPRMMSIGQKSSGLLYSTSATSPEEAPRA